jgi:peptide/nickel transport system substrate-binding protein
MSGQTFTRAELLQRAGAAGGLLLAPGVLAACGGSAGNERVEWGTNGAINNLDQRIEFGIANTVATASVQDALFNLDSRGRLRPGLATEERRIDARTYLYTLRPGLRFSDGTRLTANDVVASLTASAKEGAATASRFATIEGVAARGAHQVTAHLKQTTGLFRYALATGPGNITSARFLAEGDSGTARRKVLGTGPYEVSSFVPDKSVAYTANRHYWGRKPRISNVVLTTISDDAARLVAMQSEELDGSFNVPSGQADAWRRISGTRVALVADMSCAALIFNTTKAPYDDVHVRRAIAHCWDRAGLVKSILHGRGRVAAAIPMPEQFQSLLPAAEVERLYASIPQYDLDIGAARRDLAQSRSAGGFRDEISYPTGYNVLGLALQALAAQARKISIDLTVREVPLNRWIEELSDPSKGIKILQTIALTSDPSEKTVPFYSPPTPTGINWALYRNDEVAALLDEAVRTLDGSARARILGRTLAHAAVDVPYAPLWWPQNGIAIRDSLTIPGPTSFTQLTAWARDLHRADA